MDTMLQNTEGIINIADNIIVFGTDQETHDKNLEALMIRAEQYGLVFNASKCNISKDEVSFFGQLYNKDGISADPDRTRAISQMQTPTTIAELRSFIGIASYMSPFINNMSELLTPLRELTHIHFDWTSSHEQRFIQIKNTLCRTTSLAYYDPTLPTVIQVDASGNGLGAVLLQNERPICFASRTLTPAEKRYANIERELLAVVFGCERFHHFVFGIDFTIESDHKPLEMIILKHIASAPARLQRLLLRLQSYHLSIYYKPCKELTIAHALSRDKSNMNTEHEEKNEEMMTARNDDEEHQRLRKYIFTAGP